MNISSVIRIGYKLPRALILLSFRFPFFRLFLDKKRCQKKKEDNVDIDAGKHCTAPNILGVPQPQNRTKTRSLPTCFRPRAVSEDLHYSVQCQNSHLR